MTTVTRNGPFPVDPLAAAKLYLVSGLAAIPLLSRSKEPHGKAWTSMRMSLEAVEKHFPLHENRNVGILNGEPSGNLADVDFDCREALCAASTLLQASPWVFGRQSAPSSHWIFKTDTPLNTAQEGYEDLDGSMLVELRGTGGQTMFPPSIHPSGERVAWEKWAEELPEIQLNVLRAGVGAVAAAALLARHWPVQGSRDKAALALTGALLRTGWDQDKVSQFVEAVAVAAGDEEYRARASKAAPTAAKQTDGKDTTGWPTLVKLLGDRGGELVDRVQKWLGMSAPARPADVTVEAVSWPKPPAEEAFHGLAGRIVRTIEPSTEADPAALLVQTLIAFGNAAGRSAHFRVEDNCHYPNEFAVLVGRTSKARKGTSWGRAVHLMEEADEKWFNERVASGVSSGEGMIWAVRDPISKRERIREKGEVRYEEVEADPGIEDKRLLIYEPEFANVLKQTERTGNTASVVLRQAWDGCKVLRTLTKNTPATSTGAFISLVGHITADELRRYLSQTETANGFGNRFLYVCADRSKLLPEGGQVDPEAWVAHRGDLVRALEFAKSIGEIKRDQEARALWCQIYGELSEGKPGLAGALLARSEAHVMRLALIYALLDCSTSIQAPHLLAGLALWDYCDRSVRYIFGDSLGDDVADELLRLLRSCLPSGMTRTDISNYFQRHVSANRLGRALGVLLQNKLVRREEEQTGGRSSERWFAIRK